MIIVSVIDTKLLNIITDGFQDYKKFGSRYWLVKSEYHRELTVGKIKVLINVQLPIKEILQAGESRVQM